MKWKVERNGMTLALYTCVYMCVCVSVRVCMCVVGGRGVIVRYAEGIKNQLSCNNHKLVYESQASRARNLALPRTHTHTQTHTHTYTHIWTLSCSLPYAYIYIYICVSSCFYVFFCEFFYICKLLNFNGCCMHKNEKST